MRMRDLSRWNIVSVPVEKSEDDTRNESYKIEGSNEEWDTLHRKVEKVGELDKSEQIQLVDQLAGDCPNALSENRRSLGIVRPEALHNYELVPREDSTYQATINMERRVGKKEFPYKLYLEYTCDGCEAKGNHRQHCIEWGIYLYWDDNDELEGVLDALCLTDDSYTHYFFVGNMRHQLTSYIVISDLRFSESDMFEAGVTTSGQADLNNW